MNENIVEMRGINKQFNSIPVLKDVTFSVKRGEVHSLYGENGAGKSVLMKLLSGVLKPDSGEIYVSGCKVDFNDPRDAQNLGIVTIHQEQNLFSDLAVAENMFISNLSLVTNIFNTINRKKMLEKSSEILKSLNFDIDPRRMVKDLSAGERQMVEIAKALVHESSLIIMDEPTNSLTEVEIENLFKIIRNIKSKGISVIFISHRIDELMKITDTVTIIRDGEVIITDTIKNIGRGSLISLSAGKDLKERYPKLPIQKGRLLFKVSGLSTNRKINNISFEIHKGEILGIAGLVGSGRTAVARAIFGVDKLVTGSIYLNGTRLDIRSPRDAIKAGIGYVSEERLSESLIGDFNISENITLSNIKAILNKGFLSQSKEMDIGRIFIKKLVVKTPFAEQKVKNLSGGNQQKVVISKWLFKESKLLIFDEPTYGLDTGSKVEVYNIMNEIVRNNSAIILISSDLSELIGMSDRILIMCDGSINGELSRSEFTPEKVLSFAAGETGKQ